MSLRKWLTDPGGGGRLADTGLLFIRVAFGVSMAYAHGWGKVVGVFTDPTRFGNPIGIGPAPSKALAAFAEFLCASAVAAGLWTRAAAIPPIVVMLVAVFIVHGADPFDNRELAILYLAAFAAVLLAGPGRFSLDATLKGGSGKR